MSPGEVGSFAGLFFSKGRTPEELGVIRQTGAYGPWRGELE